MDSEVNYKHADCSKVKKFEQVHLLLLQVQEKPGQKGEQYEEQRKYRNYFPVQKIMADIRFFRENISEYEITIDVHQQKIDEARELLEKDWMLTGQFRTEREKKLYLITCETDITVGEAAIQSCKSIIGENQERIKELALMRNRLLKKRKGSKRIARKIAGEK